MIRSDIEKRDEVFFGDASRMKWYCPLCDLYSYGDRCGICGVELQPIKELTEEEKEELRVARISRAIAFSSASELLEEEEDPEKNV